MDVTITPMSDDAERLQAHFDMRLHALSADLNAMRAGQDVVGARVEAVNARMAVADNRQIEILEQVKRTNGRVSELEGWRKYEEGKAAGSGSSWRIIIAASTVVGALVGGTVAIIGLVVGG
jgi:hypothetical protein